MNHIDIIHFITAYCELIGNDPVTYKEADQSYGEWKEAIENELKAHRKLYTWEETKLPRGGGGSDR